MFKSDQNVIHNGALCCVCLLRAYQDVESVSRGLYLFRPDLFSHTCPVAVSQMHAHKPGRTPGQGLQSKGMSKGKSPSKRAEGSRRERADWIKNKGTDSWGGEAERELLFSNRVRGVEY